MKFLSKTEKRIGAAVALMAMLVWLLFGGFVIAYQFAGEWYIKTPNPFGIAEEMTFRSNGVEVTATAVDAFNAAVKITLADGTEQHYTVFMGDPDFISRMWGGFAFRRFNYVVGNGSYAAVYGKALVEGEGQYFEVSPATDTCPEWAALCFQAADTAINAQFHSVRTQNPILWCLVHIFVSVMFGVVSACVLHFAGWVISRMRSSRNFPEKYSSILTNRYKRVV